MTRVPSPVHLSLGSTGSCRPPRRRPLATLLGVALLLPAAAGAQHNELRCTAKRDRPLLPSSRELCDSLAEKVRRPDPVRLAEYETVLGQFIANYCHRDGAAGWERDKHARSLGPYSAQQDDENQWQGSYVGTHHPVVIWYSPEMIAWLEANRGEGAPEHGPDPTRVPDGAIMVKEMFKPPIAGCTAVDPLYLFPESGTAVMVRAEEVSVDGWYWAYVGIPPGPPDWPAPAGNPLPNEGFGQYCLNCHASARDNLTFAALANIAGHPGEPLVFLSQHSFFADDPEPSLHEAVALAGDDAARASGSASAKGSAATAAPAETATGSPAEEAYVPKLLSSRSRAHSLPFFGDTRGLDMPSQTYDNVWVEAGGPTATSQFVTSDQCLGCHDAGGTGIGFDMTVPKPVDGPYGDDGTLLNLSEYGTWVSSPMGLAGRDPIFFAQLASEIDTFHPEISPTVQDICLGCHGVAGQRQFHIDNPPSTPDGECTPFLREVLNAVPFPPEDPGAAMAKFGALGRDGITCTACHHMEVGVSTVPDDPQNACVRQRQELLNSDNTGFARTFTGSYVVGDPKRLYGPFGAGTEEDPAIRPVPMEHALGITPTFAPAIRQSEVCASCHTVHLPVYEGGRQVMRENGEPFLVYEQTTYPEWLFSAYRTGETPDGQGTLPEGAGELAETCQSCHMPSADRATKRPYSSKIAGIQEYSNFPQTENTAGAADLDLPIRQNYARHTLVGLNLFLIEMAQQFPDILGIRTTDPMLVSSGVESLVWTEQQIVEQAEQYTAAVTVGTLAWDGSTLDVPVTVESLVGHKFPSGVGFRRAFLELAVKDASGNTLWISGGTDATGTIVDADGQPIAGERFWTDDCSRRLPTAYQPHYQTITRQDQAQVYQELVAAPVGANPQCGDHTTDPAGPLTTSFLSICDHVKDNRILPKGFLPLAQRVAIAEAIGAREDLAETTGAYLGGQSDPDFGPGSDSLVYSIDLGSAADRAATVEATLYWQATPPFYLQDRFCTSDSTDTERLFYLVGELDLSATRAADWKLEVTGSGSRPVPARATKTAAAQGRAGR